MVSKSDVCLFWNLMVGFASMHEHFPTIHTAQVEAVPSSFGDTYYSFIPDAAARKFADYERIHVDIGFGFQWNDDEVTIGISTVTIGFGPRSNKIVHKPVERLYRYGDETE